MKRLRAITPLIYLLLFIPGGYFIVHSYDQLAEVSQKKETPLSTRIKRKSNDLIGYTRYTPTQDIFTQAGSLISALESLDSDSYSAEVKREVQYTDRLVIQYTRLTHGNLKPDNKDIDYWDDKKIWSDYLELRSQNFSHIPIEERYHKKWTQSLSHLNTIKEDPAPIIPPTNQDIEFLIDYEPSSYFFGFPVLCRWCRNWDRDENRNQPPASDQ